MNELIKKILGESYGWRDELLYLGNPLSWHWMTEYEKAGVQLAWGAK